MTWRRCIGASAAGLSAQVITYLALTLLFTFLTLNDLAGVLPITSSTTFTLTHLIAIQPLIERKIRACFSAPSSFILFSALYASAYEVGFLTAVTSALISQVTGLGLACLTLQIIDVTTSNRDVRGLRLFKAFSDAWLLNDPSSLEAIFKQKGEVTRVQVTSLVFRSQRGVEGCFITFDAHPGPFKNVGGSNLPADISRAVELKLGGVCLAFHSTATHERDPVSREEAAKIVEAAVRASLKARLLTEPLCTQFARSTEAEPHIYCQVLGIPIISMTWRRQRAEDLPYILGIELKSELKKMGFTDALIIDAHNCHLPTEPPPKLNLNEVKLRVIRTVDNAVMRVMRGRIKAAFGSLPPPYEFEEVGAAGIKLALISIGGLDSIYILIDANNLDPATHQAFLNKLLNRERRGFDFAEVYTTDTHSVVGLKATKGGYRAFGEGRKSEDIVSLICKKVDSLRRQLVEVEVEVGTEEVEVEVIGEHGLTSFLRQLRRGVSIVRGVLPLIYIFGITLPPLLMLWLPHW